MSPILKQGVEGVYDTSVQERHREPVKKLEWRVTILKEESGFIEES